MSSLDNFLVDKDDAQWDSDTESVEQDKFNKTRFDKVAARSDSEPREAPVSGKTRTAADLEAAEILDMREREQAVELKREDSVPRKWSAPKRTESVAKKPEAVVQRTESAVQRAPSKAFEFKHSAVPPKPDPEAVPPPAPVPVQTSASGSANHDKAFEGRYPQEVVEFFSEVNKKSFTQQAIDYLNAYWAEIGSQAEFIFSVAIKVFREADMHRQGISLIYKYEEGNDVDYPTYLYFYEKLVKYVNEHPEWRTGEYEKSAVYEVKTAIKHKNDLREKVDVNFDGRISFLEYLLYQYNQFSNPADYVMRAKLNMEEHPAILEARKALDEVNNRIRAYEEERARLMKGAEEPGVKGLSFKHQLTMLDKSPLSEKLNEALITAEAAVRIAVKKFAGAIAAGGAGAKGVPQGALWWMQRDLDEKKRVMVPATLRRVKKNK